MNNIMTDLLKAVQTAAELPDEILPFATGSSSGDVLCLWVTEGTDLSCLSGWKSFHEDCYAKHMVSPKGGMMTVYKGKGNGGPKTEVKLQARHDGPLSNAGVRV